jgi:hypothetical protein
MMINMQIVGRGRLSRMSVCGGFLAARLLQASRDRAFRRFGGAIKERDDAIQRKNSVGDRWQ